MVCSCGCGCNCECGWCVAVSVGGGFHRMILEFHVFSMECWVFANW